jgi:hypothetical protein
MKFSSFIHLPAKQYNFILERHPLKSIKPGELAHPVILATREAKTGE